MKLHTELFDIEGTYTTYTEDIMVDGIKVGRADTIVNSEEDEVYLEWIAIDEDFRGQGYGTQAMKMLAKKYSFIYFAPCDERNKELYERIAEEMESDAPDVDQGFGVYYMEA